MSNATLMQLYLSKAIRLHSLLTKTNNIFQQDVQSEEDTVSFLEVVLMKLTTTTATLRLNRRTTLENASRNTSPDKVDSGRLVGAGPMRIQSRKFSVPAEAHMTLPIYQSKPEIANARAVQTARSNSKKNRKSPTPQVSSNKQQMKSTDFRPKQTQQYNERELRDSSGGTLPNQCLRNFHGGRLPSIVSALSESPKDFEIARRFFKKEVTPSGQNSPKELPVNEKSSSNRKASPDIDSELASRFLKPRPTHQHIQSEIPKKATLDEAPMDHAAKKEKFSKHKKDAHRRKTLESIQGLSSISRNVEEDRSNNNLLKEDLYVGVLTERKHQAGQAHFFPTNSKTPGSATSKNLFPSNTMRQSLATPRKPSFVMSGKDQKIQTKIVASGEITPIMQATSKPTKKDTSGFSSLLKYLPSTSPLQKLPLAKLLEKHVKASDKKSCTPDVFQSFSNQHSNKIVLAESMLSGECFSMSVANPQSTRSKPPA